MIDAKVKQWARIVQSCKKCHLCNLTSRKITHSFSTPPPTTKTDILFLGEAPGMVEYISKEPFVGPAGDTLKYIIEQSIPLRYTYIISNVILCTPFTDESLSSIKSPPSFQEIDACRVWVSRLLTISKPTYIIGMGRTAEKTLKALDYQFLHIKHPSAINRSDEMDYELASAIVSIKQYIGEE